MTYSFNLTQLNNMWMLTWGNKGIPPLLSCAVTEELYSKFKLDAIDWIVLHNGTRQIWTVQCHLLYQSAADMSSFMSMYSMIGIRSSHFSVIDRTKEMIEKDFMFQLLRQPVESTG